MPTGLNVADFDTVILNFAAFENEGIRRTVPLDNVPGIQQFIRLAFSEDSLVVAIGDPRYEFGYTAAGTRRQGWTYRQATWWLPVDLPVQGERGEVVSNIDADWSFWFDHVRGFAWHFVSNPRQPESAGKLRAALEAVPAGATFFAGQWEPLAEPRYGEPIGVELTLSALRATTGGRNLEVVTQSNAIFWLPPSTELDQHEATDLLLRNIGVRVEAAPPAWLASYRLPRQLDAERAVQEQEAALNAAEAELEAAAAHAETEARFQKLLYEQGQEALEEVVRDALGQLGATVSEPSHAGIEDRRLTEARHGAAMLEIKARAGQLALGDVRQLDGWMRTAMADEAWDGKGILVANLRLNEPPGERSDVVAPNALAFAERVGISILTTPQLYEAIRRDQEGALNREVFWDAVFAATGIVDLPSVT